MCKATGILAAHRFTILADHHLWSGGGTRGARGGGGAWACGGAAHWI